jgi:hypothetical protein
LPPKQVINSLILRYIAGIDLETDHGFNIKIDQKKQAPALLLL